MPVLSQLQQLLAGIYDIPLAHDVADFLFTERAGLPAALRSSPGDEQVLVEECDGEAAIGVFVDAGVLRRLERSNPMGSLHGGNLADMLTALEGVSHFMYLAWNASHDRGVSLLELELQAEVDKYVASLALLRAQHPAHYPRELHRLLFVQAQVDPQLAGERFDLYRRAHEGAARYCRRLERQLCSGRRALQEAIGAELRRFYRWGPARKFRFIEQLA